MKSILFAGMLFLSVAGVAQAEGVQKASQEAEDWLLLVKNKKAPFGVQTVWVKQSPLGIENVAITPIPLIALGETLYGVFQEETAFQTYRCEDVFTEDREARMASGKVTKETHSYQRAVLRDALNASAKPIWQSNAVPFAAEGDDIEDQAGDFHARVTLTALVGPYVNFEECDDIYRCGVHGGAVCTSQFWSLEKGTTIDCKAQGFCTMPDLTTLKTLKWESSDGIDIRAEDVKVESVRSRYTQSGLALDLLLSHGVAYASSGLDWSSYTTSALYSQPKIPDLFKAYSALPIFIRESAYARRDLLVGLSPLPKSEAVKTFIKQHANAPKPIEQP